MLDGIAGNHSTVLYRVSHKFVYRFQIALTLELLNRFKPNLGSM